LAEKGEIMSLAKPTPDEIKVILSQHALWLADYSKGARANLTRANLTRADLSGAYLSGANLTRANLTRANLSGANLTGADLSGADLTGADLSGANLTGADLSGANLTGADLSGANLSWANLSGAYLSWANLSGANLSGAYLSGAYLSGAVGIVRDRHVDLLMLLDQPGPIRAYKMVTKDGDSPIHEIKLRYEVGLTVEVANANTDPNEPCGVGIHVATLPWILREWREGHRVLLVEFVAADIACIPTATDGKFRLHRCTVVAEKDVSAFVGAK
jgi:hypothetical protein